MSVQEVQQTVVATLDAVPRESTERQRGAFSQVTALPQTFSINPDDSTSLYRARMDNRDVVLRVLRGTESSERTYCRSQRSHCRPQRGLTAGLKEVLMQASKRSYCRP